MPLSVSGTVIRILPEVTGQGRNGTWRKREFVIETGDQYPKQICMVQWGDEIDAAALREGEAVTAHIDIASREYNGKWYTDIKAWKIERGADGDEVPAPLPAKKKANLDEFDAVDDDLPF